MDKAVVFMRRKITAVVIRIKTTNSRLTSLKTFHLAYSTPSSTWISCEIHRCKSSTPARNWGSLWTVALKSTQTSQRLGNRKLDRGDMRVLMLARIMELWTWIFKEPQVIKTKTGLCSQALWEKHCNRNYHLLTKVGIIRELIPSTAN